MRREQLEQLWGAPVGAGAASLPSSVGLPCTDTRSLEPGALFVPLVGEHHDGHRFLAQAAAAGAVAALVQRDHLPQLGDPAGWPLPAWLVPDTLQAYQDLAGLHRRQLGAAVVAVTGSAGKTTTRELIRALLALRGPVLASSGNENNDIGVPLTLLRAEPGHRAVVVEMGMRGLGEIARLSRCASPDLAVITNIGTAHIGRLGSREAIAQAKCEVVQALNPQGLVVIPAGDPLLEQALAAVWRGAIRRVALSSDPELAGAPAADLLAEVIEGSDGPALRLLRGGDGGRALPLPLAGRHNARNLLLALAVAASLDPLPIPADELATLALDLPAGRSRTEAIAGIEVLDETYNASPEAVLAALDLLAARPGRRFAVLGTMLELGEESLNLHRRVAERAASLGLDGLVIVDGGAEGEVMAAAASALARVARVASVAEALDPLQAWLQPGDQLLLKASRGVALERLLPLLHQALNGG